MNINPVGPAAVLSAKPSDGRAVEGFSAKPTPAAQSSAKAVASASVTLSSPLSAETRKDLAFATQNVALQDEEDHKIPPAQQARAALADNPELGGRPFGALVSSIARGLPLLAPNSSSQSEEEASPQPISDPPIDPPLDIPATEEQIPVDLGLPNQDQSPTVLDLVIEELANTPAIDPLLIPPDVIA